MITDTVTDFDGDGRSSSASTASTNIKALGQFYAKGLFYALFVNKNNFSTIIIKVQMTHMVQSD